MSNFPLWEILWLLAALVTGALMFGAWSGPHRSVSNLSRWATRLRIRPIPAWLSARAADRWVFRGGIVSLVLLLAVAWLMPSPPPPGAPLALPDRSKGPAAPEAPGGANSRPDRHLDTELQNAILVHVPKTKRVRIAVLHGDAEADQFSWEIDAFLRTAGYNVVSPRLTFAMAAGGKTPTGTAIYPDEKDPNIVVIRIGLNDRS
ncbi:MAG: hypothetical protein QOH81_1157 [Sphingomonadales bacterium]|nr:hypothetical protein [Sphingomonadales bacterium]